MLLAMLVWDVKATNLKSHLKKQKIKGYLESVSDNLIAVASKEITDNGESMSLRTSIELQTRTVLLVHTEDYGWGFNGYFKGEQTGSFFLKYDAPADQNLAENTLFDFAANPRKIVELSNCLNSAHEESIYENSWNLFEEVLGIEISNDFNFDSLEGLPEGILIQCGIEISTPKRSFLKKMIKKHMEPSLTESGFISNTTTMLPCDFAYFKNVDGFFTGIMIIKDEDSINSYLKTLYGNIPLFSPGERYFKNEDELVLILQETSCQFERKLDEYKDQMSFDVFDCGKIFKEYMNDYLLTKGYRMIESSIEQLSGGEILYRRIDEDHDISFSHSQYYLGLVASYIKGEFETVIHIHDEAGNSVSRNFKNQEEYIEILEKYKIALDKLEHLA
ncbi:hypothetical protein J2T13_003166 [Paenibacillus sp. DS2015]|uniref:hypothetical protein n=1 Tax=Paenibacillus sp. DS2015 TaxID=3373917 RepID=UPI003D240F48